MKERPIIFNLKMVRAILDGRKTQTRRPIKDVNEYGWFNIKKTSGCNIHEKFGRKIALEKCPYGKVGDRLWVKHIHYLHGKGTYNEQVYNPFLKEIFFKQMPDDKVSNIRLDLESDFWKKCPSIHMPRWASRITLEITDVRVERVQEITETDAISEGCCNANHPDFHVGVFKDLWNSLWSKKGYGWDVNPWIWVISFKSTLKNE